MSKIELDLPYIAVPYDEVNKKVRLRIWEETGSDPGPMNIRNLTLGTEFDHVKTKKEFDTKWAEHEEELIATMTRTFIAIENGELEEVGPTKSLQPQRTLRQIVQEIGELDDK